MYQRSHFTLPLCGHVDIGPSWAHQKGPVKIKVGFKAGNTEQDKKVLYSDKPNMCAPKPIATKYTK